MLSILDNEYCPVPKKLKQHMYGANHMINFAVTDEEQFLDNFAKYKKFVVCVMNETSLTRTNRIIEEATNILELNFLTHLLSMK